ncbi:MAG: choice-of-anchor B domain-containing protein [Cognaticolwellia sp.]|jgi:choice-of-anchor B domain-containing protein
MLKKTLFVFAMSFISLMTFAQNLNVAFVGQLQYTEDANDIWGYKDTISGIEYALVGLRGGTSIVSLANPANPVQVGYVAGANSTWRDIKTWGQYAYVTTDVGTDGLTVIDLSNLSNGVTSTNWQPTLTVNGQTGVFEKAHNIWMDENGYAYISGANLGNGGVMILDVHTTPGTPIYLGTTPNNYSHDCYARGDTLYTADIYVGEFTVYDVSNKANPVYLGSQPTELAFAHNVWLSDDGQTLFTTDEKPNAPVGAYDVSNPSNIVELDQFRPLQTLGQGVIPHNVHVWDDYLIVSYYTDGLILVDASRPGNLIEVGNFDTYISSSGGFNGSWGAYPYLPSGMIIVSDINSGLYIFQPTYVRACWLEGTVTNAANGNLINNANIEILGALATDDSDVFGEYETGLATSGTYDVQVLATGYMPEMVTVTLSNGQVTVQDFQLTPAIPFVVSGQVLDEQGSPIEDAKVFVQGLVNDYSFVTDINGDFSATIENGRYDVLVGNWGYKTKLIQDTIINVLNSNIVIELETGYKDEFALDLGWQTVSNAQTGAWERVTPIGIPSTTYGQVSPALDIQTDLGSECYITQNGGSTPGNGDVDNGTVRLLSPTFDATTFTSAHVRLATWFVNVGGNGTPDDALTLQIFNGDSTVTIEEITLSDSVWTMRDYQLSDYIVPSAMMRFFIKTSDIQGSGHIVEAGIDDFEVYEGQPVSTSPIESMISIKTYPNPFMESMQVEYKLTTSSATLQVYNLVGQLMESHLINNKDGSISIGNNLESGVYVIRILEEGKVSLTRKIVKLN